MGLCARFKFVVLRASVRTIAGTTTSNVSTITLGFSLHGVILTTTATATATVTVTTSAKSTDRSSRSWKNPLSRIGLLLVLGRIAFGTGFSKMKQVRHEQW